MINSFYGKLIYKNNNEIYLQNVNGCCELYFENNKNLKIGNEYFFIILIIMYETIKDLICNKILVF